VLLLLLNAHLCVGLGCDMSSLVLVSSARFPPVVVAFNLSLYFYLKLSRRDVFFFCSFSFSQIITTEAPSRVETPAVASSSPAAVVAALTPDRRKKTPASSPAAARLSPPVARRPRPKEYLRHPPPRHPPVSSFSPESAGLPPRPRSPLRLSVKQTRGLVARLLLLY
jgi:hypothetical protein